MRICKSKLRASDAGESSACLGDDAPLNLQTHKQWRNGVGAHAQCSAKRIERVMPLCQSMQQSCGFGIAHRLAYGGWGRGLRRRVE